jgi:hypothetical protein
MRRLAFTTTVLTAFLVLAPPAAAKGPVTVKICGQDDCIRVKDDFTDPHGPGGTLVNTDSLDFAAAPAPNAFYTLEIGGDWMDRELSYFVPDAGVLRVGSNWLALGSGDAAALRAAIGQLAPFPPPRLTRALVNGRPAANAAPYFALLEALPAADYAPPLARKVEIVLKADRPNPWTDVRRPFEYYPRQNLLHRQVEWRIVPAGVAAVIERDAGLVSAAGSSRSTWPGYLAATLLGLGLIAVIALNQRSRRRAVVRSAAQTPAAERPAEPTS